MPESFRTPGSECPRCGNYLDAAMGIEKDKAPGPGDVSLCVYCFTWLRYTDDLTVRPLTKEDFEDMPLEVLELIDNINQRLKEIKGRGLL